MADHAHSTDDLTKNQALVMGALTEADGPLSAYTILDQLRDDGFRAPLQVYRALDKLRDAGLVHRLESLNAFVACRHASCAEHSQTIFMICETCGKVAEISDSALTRRLSALATEADFGLTKATIELRGICRTCEAG